MSSDRQREVGELLTDRVEYIGSASVFAMAEELAATKDAIAVAVDQQNIAREIAALLEEENAELESQIKLAVSLHGRSDGQGDGAPFCRECGDVFPCRTVRVLTEATV